jgi:hypothetical protein
MNTALLLSDESEPKYIPPARPEALMSEPLKAALQGGRYAPSCDGSIPRTGSLPSQNIQQKQSGSRVPKTKSKRIDDEVRRRLGVDEQFQSTEPGERLAESWREANKDFFGPLRKSDFQPDQRFGKQLLCRSMRAEI